MSDIFEKINKLTEKFSNLFEVDDLGQPAMDVPPSQNKIKRDRKTKNGKVELVSVEDELFPYEGNKREQYRQKILDTINNMIQGTATLEDLLQITRQKKAPLKEAMELVEDLYSYIKKRHGEPKYKGSASEPDNASAKLIYKSDEAKGKEYDQEKEKNPDVNLYNKRFQTKNTKGEKETERRSRNYRKFTDDWKLPKTDDEKIEGSIARHEKKEQKKAPLKEAMELTENIYSQIKKVHGEDHYNPMNKSAKLVTKASDIFNKEISDSSKREGRDTREKRIDARVHNGEWTTNHGGSWSKHANDYEGTHDPEATEKSIARHEKKEQKKAPLKEAVELMEDIHKMIDKHGDKIGPKSELHDLMKMHQRSAAIQYGEEKGKPYGKRWQDEQDFEDRRKGEDTKNYKGQRKTTEKQFKGFGTVTVGGAEPTELEKKIRRDHAKRDGKHVQDYPFDGDIDDYTQDGSKPQKIIDKSVARHNKKVANNPLKEAVELLESLEAAVEKKYGKLFDKNLSTRGLIKHHKLGDVQTNEIVDAAKRNLPDEEKNSSIAIDKEVNKIEARRNNTKNKVGQYMTDLRTVGYGGKLRGLSEIPDNRKADAESGYKTATEKSVNRHAKKHAKVLEALSIMEDLFSTIMKQPIEDRADLMYKYHQAKKKDTRDTYTKGQEEEKHKSKEEKGEEKTKQRKLYKGKTIEDWKQGRLMDQIANNAKKLGKLNDLATANAIHRHQVKEWKKGTHESLEESLNILLEGRKEGESQKDFKHRLHGELVRAIDKKAAEARDKAIEASKNYYETGKGRAEAIKASEKAKKEHDKLDKLDDIEPVANAYTTVESLKEAIELFEQLLSEEDFHARKGNPVVKITDKNYRVASGKSLPGPFNKNHIGQYIVYNKDTDASYLVTPDNWKKSKIKRDLEKQGKVYEAIRLMEELLNEKVTVAKWVEAAKKVKDVRADKASKELVKNIFRKEDNGDEAHNAVHRQAHAEAVSKLAPSDDNAQDVREIHRAAIEPLRKKVDRAVKAGKSKTEAVKRLEKAQEIAGVRPDSSKYVN